MQYADKALIPAPHGQLEAIYRPGATQGARAALVLHPHPQYGGTMHNKVVFHCARALQEAGFATLRFNFRGVEESTGRYDNGRGEIDDARLALDFLLARESGAKEVLVAGFSFGAGIGLRFGCADERVDRLIAIGTPTGFGGFVDAPLLAGCTKPKLFVHGGRDDLAPLAGLRRLLDELPASNPAKLVELPAASHFFDDHLDELRAAILAFVD
ncbi:MAG TPA: alpha/beta fold hydrolase [Candidatus Bathyarchaeia archaeon]|nr:alpha/beta fold hydrolase [Candidatus Bathyarchaeia archaeon]